MSYNSAIPQSTDYQDQSQAQILGNFTSIGAFMNPDNSEFLTAIKLDVVADPATAASQVAVYAKNGATSGVPELWYRPQSSGAAVAMTESLQMSQAAGWTRLPSGVLLKWGSQTGIVPNSGGQYVTFPVNVLTTPAFANIFSVQVTAIGTGGNTGSIWATSFTTTQILLWSTGSGLTACNWFAIGN